MQQNLLDIRKVNFIITKQGKRRVSSGVWNQFYQLFETENNNDIINWYLCLLCHEPVENKHSGTTTVFHRHQKQCLQKKDQKSINEFFGGKPIENTKISEKHIAAIKDGSIRFICDDLRPYVSMEGSGLFQLFSAAVELGKSYPTITIEDIKRILPSRRTVQRAVEDKLSSIKEMISKKLFQALETCDGFVRNSLLCHLKLSIYNI